MCDSGDFGKKRYFFGPFDDGEPQLLMSLEAAIEDLKTNFEDGSVGDEFTYRVVELTDAEAEALPEL